MSYSIDETYIRCPELWTPKRKPSCHVKIDPTHPLAKYYEGHYLPTWPTQYSYFDNSGKHDLTIAGTLGFSGTDNGLVLDSGGIYEATGLWHLGDQNVQGKGHSIFWCGIFTSGTSSTNQRLFGHRHVSGSRYFISFLSGSSAVAFYAGSEFTCNTNVETYKYQSAALCGVRTATNKQFLFHQYWNGLEDHNYLSNNITSFMDDIRLGFNVDYTSAIPFSEGGTYLAINFNKELSATEVNSLHNDPYQIFIPA